MSAATDASTESWQRFKRVSHDIEGWFTDAASCASDAMLRFQSEIGVQGDLFEIGAWHGKSASLWLVHCRKTETVHIIDFECREPLGQNVNRIAADLGVKVNLTKNTSFRFPDSNFLSQHRRSMRLIHIDGDHSGPGISNDLNVCADMLSLFGVMIVDDFLNPRFPQISEAVFGFLADRRRDFSMFACGANKAFICTAKGYDRWGEFAKARLGEEIRAQIPGLATFDGSCENRPVLGLR